MKFLISMGLILAWSSGAHSQHRSGLSQVSPPILRIGQPTGVRPPAQSFERGIASRVRGGFSPVGPPVVRTGPPTGIRPGAQSWGAGLPIGARPSVPRWGVHPPNGVSPPTGVRPPDAWCGHDRFNNWDDGAISLVPYAVPYPVYFNGGSYPGYPNGEYYLEIPYSYDPQFGPAMARMPAQPPPPVAMNQYVPDPGPAPPGEGSTVQANQAPTSPRPDPVEPQRPTLFIAMKDGWVYTASDYWVEGGTLHYITTQGKHDQVSLDFVDRQTSARLNSDKVLQLPPP